MILQSLCFPELLDEEHHLYIRYEETNCDVDDKRERITCHKNTLLHFNTYFNSLSYGKYVKYTNINDLYLSIKIKGTFEIVIYSVKYANKTAVQTEVLRKIIKSTSRIPQEVKIDIPLKNFYGFYAFDLIATENNAVYAGGYYGCNISNKALNSVNLAIVICHYNKQEYVKENLNILSAAVFNNKNSVINEHLKVYVSDNSRNLDISDMPSVKVFPNKNTGGAGGFSRGILEVSDDKAFCATHIVLTDDDTIISRVTFERLYTFLRVLKKEYFDNTIIGGAMLYAEEKWLQYGNGETWSVEGMQFNKINYNLYVVEDILRNEIEEESINQFAWWCFCYPLNERTKNNLALPLFFQYDDIDFNQRFKDCNKISLNGICLWHDGFETKYSLSKEYYAIRNRLIICAIHGEKFSKKFIKNLLLDVLGHNIVLYRYKCAELACRAVEDFFKGFEWLSSQDPDLLNKELQSIVYREEEVLEDERENILVEIEKNVMPNETKQRRKYRRTVLNGMFFPTKTKKIVVATHHPIKAHFFRVKSAMNYNPYTNKCFIVKRDIRKTIKLGIMYLKCLSLIDKKFEEIVNDYKINYPKYISSEFWRRYLEL